MTRVPLRLKIGLIFLYLLPSLNRLFYASQFVPQWHVGLLRTACENPKNSWVESDESISIWSFIIVPSPMHHLFDPESMGPVGLCHPPTKKKREGENARNGH